MSTIQYTRLSEYGEHVDDHQLQLIKQFSDLNLIYSCEDVSKLNIALEIVENTEYRNYVSNTKTIINSIENFIQETINEQI